MESQLRTADLVVLLIYMAGVVGLGCWFARKSGTPGVFMAAGGSLPGWAVGLSIFGTYVSSIGFLGNTGKAFGSDWSSWVLSLSLPVAALIAVRWFVPLYRSSGEISAYHHLEVRFGPWARTYALVCYLLSQLARIGTILYLVALALAPLTGWDVRTIILVTGLLVTVYTLVGGIEAVIWTDVVQSVVLIAGALLCAVLIVAGMPQGPSQLFEIAREHEKFSLGGFSLSPGTLFLKEPTFWIVLLYGVFINVQNFGIAHLLFDIAEHIGQQCMKEVGSDTTAVGHHRFFIVYPLPQLRAGNFGRSGIFHEVINGNTAIATEPGR
jgi:SSS family solute:Na+ symporter